MTTIGILSDTHSCWDDRYELHFSACQEIWHAGDVGDIEILRRLREICPVVRAVSGNIDHGAVARECPKELEFEVDGAKVWMTHIGGYPGRYAKGVKNRLLEVRPKIMIAGHSHILKVINDPVLGLLHINPGAAGYYGWHAQRTLMRLTIDDGKPCDLEIIELGKRCQV